MIGDVRPKAVEIREAGPADWPPIWEIFRVVVGASETYSFAPDTTEAEARRLWMAPPAHTYVAAIAGAIVGTSMIRPNQPGLGAHVANAGFMVAPNASGRGIGRTMAQHALEEARRLGFIAMQFNFVAATNARAIRLWQSLGFAIVGTVPGAFRYHDQTLVDVHIMHRSL
jgi:L-amino acid N-acyltransferase YncA